MKKLIALLTLAVALCASAFAADASPAVLAQSTKNDVTTTITTGRVQAEAVVNADGTVTFQIYPNVTRTDSAGELVTATQLDTNAMFTVKLSADLVAKVLVEVKAAYDAAQAAKAATPPSTNIALPKTSNLVIHDTSEANAPRNTGAIYLRDHGVAISSEGKIYLTPEARKRLASN